MCLVLWSGICHWFSYQKLESREVCKFIMNVLSEFCSKECLAVERLNLTMSNYAHISSGLYQTCSLTWLTGEINCPVSATLVPGGMAASCHLALPPFFQWWITPGNCVETYTTTLSELSETTDFIRKMSRKAVLFAALFYSLGIWSNR